MLYVEDNLSNLRLVRAHPGEARRRCRLLPAMDGRTSASSSPAQHRPALILLDLHLPAMDGEEVLRSA